ncbi:MAG: hypothetical protein H0X51_09250 [Parachlamydiaceae bacterium]|nr:hypothetical protein [Parachlamydiaceae bacterium]
MAELFLVMGLVFVMLLMRWRKLALALTGVGLVMGLLMFWHHATDALKINW